MPSYLAGYHKTFTKVYCKNEIEIIIDSSSHGNFKIFTAIKIKNLKL